MMAYVGKSWQAKMTAALTAMGAGCMICPGDGAPNREPWALDNGAYRAWRQGARMSAGAFLFALAAPRATAPSFVVVPDLVASGARSMGYSLAWLDLVAVWPAPPYLAVQDGMSAGDVAPHLSEFGGVFVGGSLEWKISTGQAWVDLAHKHGMLCHVGRVGTPKRVAWAKRIGADSIDSCLPLRDFGKLRRFRAAMAGEQQDMWDD